MDGEVALLCALTSYGNAALLRAVPDAGAPPARHVAVLQFALATAPSLWSRAQSFARSISARFDLRPVVLTSLSDARRALEQRVEERDAAERARSTPVAETAAAWYRWLASHGARRLELTVVGEGDPHVAGFAGGGVRLAIDDVSGTSARRWVASQRPAHGGRAVRFIGTTIAAGEPARADVAAAERALHDAVVTARQFAAQVDELRLWTRWFDAALRATHGVAADISTAPYGPAPIAELVAPTAPPAAQRLAAAARNASVFGAMGSWNDVLLAEPVATRHREISARLYVAINHAFLAAANAPPEPAHA